MNFVKGTIVGMMAGMVTYAMNKDRMDLFLKAKKKEMKKLKKMFM